MGKPLKAKQLNLDKRGRDKVLKWQGVKVNKRIRLGHTGHFGKVDVIPISKVRNLDHGESEGTKVPQLKERSASESHSKFLKRVAQETHEAIVNLNSSKRKVTDKRRAYLESKKTALQEKKLQHEKFRVIDKATRTKFIEKESLSFDNDVSLSTSINAASATPLLRFGEQAERPPQIKLSKPMKGLKKGQPYLSGTVCGGSLVKDDCDGLSNKGQIELLRKNAVQAYRQIAQRKREQKGLLSL